MIEYKNTRGWKSRSSGRRKIRLHPTELKEEIFQKSRVSQQSQKFLEDKRHEIKQPMIQPNRDHKCPSGELFNRVMLGEAILNLAEE